MSSYFDYFSFSRARKNKEALEATNPQNPVLKEEDEQFLQKITWQEAPAPPLPNVEPTVITDDGEEKRLQDADKDVKEAVGTVLPASPSAVEDSKDGAKKEDAATEADDQAEVAMKKSWTSYIPSIPVPSIPSLTSRKGNPGVESAGAKTETDAKDAEEAKEQDEGAEGVEQAEAEVKDKQDDVPADALKEAIEDSKSATAKADSGEAPRAWTSYIPNMPSISRTPKEQAGGDLASAQVKKSGEAESDQTMDEQEVSVLLDRLNLSAINNRVFSFSKESEKIYESFTVVLKDIVNGAPTAYEDLEKLIKENEKKLDEMFGNMPPFVRTLVKSLPAKFASTLGPEVLAAASQKPDTDLKTRLAAADSSREGPSKQKQKRKVPTARSLVTEKGAVATMLRNILNFLKLRFPAFVTGTNVLMSLAVFILLFVFYYCHKRGRETRLLKESEDHRITGSASEVSDTEDTSAIEKEIDDRLDADAATAAAAEAQKILDQPEPAQVHLPEEQDDEIAEAVATK